MPIYLFIQKFNLSIDLFINQFTHKFILFFEVFQSKFQISGHISTKQFSIFIVNLTYSEMYKPSRVLTNAWSIIQTPISYIAFPTPQKVP